VPEDPTEMFVEPKNVAQDVTTMLAAAKGTPEDRNDMPDGDETKSAAIVEVSDGQFVVPTEV